MAGTIVVHMQDGCFDRAETDDYAQLGTAVVVAHNGVADTMRYAGISLESEISAYVAKARANTQVLGLGAAAEMAGEAFLEIGRTLFETPAAILTALWRARSELNRMCKQAMALQMPYDSGSPRPRCTESGVVELFPQH